MFYHNINCFVFLKQEKDCWEAAMASNSDSNPGLVDLCGEDEVDDAPMSSTLNGELAFFQYQINR